MKHCSLLIIHCKIVPRRDILFYDRTANPMNTAVTIKAEFWQEIKTSGTAFDEGIRYFKLTAGTRSAFRL